MTSAAEVPQSSGGAFGGLALLVVVAATVAFFFWGHNAPDPIPTAGGRAAPTAPAALERAGAPAPARPAAEARPEPASSTVEVTDPAAPLAESRELRPVRSPIYWYEGAQGYRQAMDEAQTEDRAVAVYFYTDWCPYCRKLDEEVLRTWPVQDHFQYVVKVKINPEKGLAEREIAEQYSVNGYPSFFIVRPVAGTAQEISYWTGSGDERRLWTPEEFVAVCRQAAGG
jgi:thiol-disulfide isomerase/thioredoxin